MSLAKQINQITKNTWQSFEKKTQIKDKYMAVRFDGLTPYFFLLFPGFSAVSYFASFSVLFFTIISLTLCSETWQRGLVDVRFAMRQRIRISGLDLHMQCFL